MEIRWHKYYNHYIQIYNDNNQRKRYKSISIVTWFYTLVHNPVKVTSTKEVSPSIEWNSIVYQQHISTIIISYSPIKYNIIGTTQMWRDIYVKFANIGIHKFHTFRNFFVGVRYIL